MQVRKEAKVAKNAFPKCLKNSGRYRQE